MNSECQGCTGTCCTGIGQDPCTCPPRYPDKPVSEPQPGRVIRTGSYLIETGVESGTITHTSARIGVPYAVIDVDTGERICPMCEARFAEDYDADGEMLTCNYAEHYQQAHDGPEYEDNPQAHWNERAAAYLTDSDYRPVEGWREDRDIPRFGAGERLEGNLP